jgi:P27 family predicted phage terminase small subunit
MLDNPAKSRAPSKRRIDRRRDPLNAPKRAPPSAESVFELMATVGPIPKAGRGEAAHGHRGKDPGTFVSAPVAVEIDRRPPSPPAHLSEPGRNAYTAAYASAGWLVTPADDMLAIQYAELHDERHELRQAIGEHGRRVKGSMGQPTDAPEVGQLRGCERQIAAVAATLGLGPANAARLGIAVKQLAPKATTNFERLQVKRGNA